MDGTKERHARKAWLATNGTMACTWGCCRRAACVRASTPRWALRRWRALAGQTRGRPVDLGERPPCSDYLTDSWAGAAIIIINYMIWTSDIAMDMFCYNFQFLSSYIWFTKCESRSSNKSKKTETNWLNEDVILIVFNPVFEYLY